MDRFFYHAVSLDKELCKGCTTCLQRCPTGAIRIRNGKAKITDELCISCGECIRVCPHHAKLADYGFILRYLDGMEHITGYGYEPWHIRYVKDVDIAKEISDAGITLEEYLDESYSEAAA